MKKQMSTILFCLALLILSACNGLSANGNANGPLQASGTIAAHEVGVAPEVGGRVVAVAVEEGDTVQAGDALFRLDDELLRAQYDQAVAAVDTAAATIDTARAQLASARVQYRITLQAARLQDWPSRTLAWQESLPEEISLPIWYFQKSEEITAARAEVEAAEETLHIELEDLETTLHEVSNADLVLAEQRVAQAQTAFRIALLTLDQASVNDGALKEVAQEQYDAALADLEAAQLAYERILSSSAYQDVLEARARAAVARAHFENTLDHLNQLLTGEQSLQVEGALAAVHQAETAVAQAEANMDQAKAALRVLQVQLDKSVVYAPGAGVVLARNLDVGEMVAPGSTVIVIGQLDEVRLTVYVPETRYGQLQLGQEAEVTVDSFPERVFAGTVVHIADKAEFTPRSVQTVEGRQSTVYAIEILVPNADLQLKPGMPADVLFEG